MPGFLYPSTRIDQGQTLGTKEKIDILLHEYDFLCNQLNARINIYYALVAGMSLLFVTVVIPVLGAGKTLPNWIVVIAALIVICFVLWWLLHKDSQTLTDRLRNLEADINQRAGGECLLKWETQLSGSAQGYWRHYLPSLFGREKGYHRYSLSDTAANCTMPTNRRT